MSLSDDVVRRILEVGRPLAEYGSNNWALMRAGALSAISAIEQGSRVVLGGDVWLVLDGRFRPTGDGWHFEPDNHQPHSVNVMDAAARAKSYIEAYPQQCDRVPYFELVVQ